MIHIFLIPGIVMVSDGQIEFASPRDEWRTLLTHYAGPIAVVVVVGLLVVIFPLAGLAYHCYPYKNNTK